MAGSAWSKLITESILLALMVWIASVNATAIPPLIEREADQLMVFREEEAFEMPCVASGQPTVEYYWEMNGFLFDPSGNDERIEQIPGEGSLIFWIPLARDEGSYQCFARNVAGVAVSVITSLRMSFIYPFPGQPPTNHYILLGEPLTFMCIPPTSYPAPRLNWGIFSEHSLLRPVNLTDRVRRDPEGNLHFAHVLLEDELAIGLYYACAAENPINRVFHVGRYSRIIAVGDEVMENPARLQYVSPSHQLALLGGTWRVACYFSGSPTPSVTWYRDGAPMPPTAKFENYDQELVIDDIQFQDGGRYECYGMNDLNTIPIRRTFDLSIEAAPYWHPGGKPVSINVTAGETAEFTCQALGLPDPVEFWFINGIPLSEIPADPRLEVVGHKLYLHNVTMDDTMVVQCNETNKHGYIFQNAYLRVIEDQERQAQYDAIQTVRERSSITLECDGNQNTVWKKDHEAITVHLNRRYKVTYQGHLHMQRVIPDDAGVYSCSAEKNRSVKLLVERADDKMRT